MGFFTQTLLFISCILPHGDLDQRILEKSNEIALHPFDQELYLERGELYLLHEEYLNAKHDFSFCIDHELDNTRVLLGMSKSLLNLNSPDSALIFLERAQPIEEENLLVLELKGTILYRLERYCEASVNMEQLLSLSHNPSPVLFLGAAKFSESCSSPGSNERAIQILKDGIKRLGSISVLQKKLVSFYKQSGRYDEAILVQTSIIESSDFKVRPYFERAQLYSEMNSSELAREDLITAISLMDKLPEYKQSIPSMGKLRTELVSALNELKN
jgi:tetratricopeptide (TPR) repeat protein